MIDASLPASAAKFFEMSRKQCKDALDIYKKFVSSMENVAKFLAVAEVSLRSIYKEQDHTVLRNVT